MSRYGPDTHDVLIVGGGGAGLRASLAIAENYKDLSVAVISKVYPMRSHTVSAEGGAAAVIKPDDSLDDHAYDTISGGDWLCDQDAVEAFVNEAPEELLRLEHWGCPWSREDNGTIAVRSFGGMKIKRTWYAADKTGFHMLHTLFQTSMKYDPIRRYDEFFVTSLIVEDGRCQGVTALELATGRIEVIAARSVILCTGGSGRVFPFTTNANIKSGDGMALAYRAGVALKDMEFVQYHPTGLPFSGILITEAARAEGGYLINKDGYRYLQDYDLGEPKPEPVLRSMELGPRDRLSQAFEQEREKGRTIKGKWGEYVHLDLKHLGEEVIDKKIPFVRELCRKYENIDPVKELIPVRPVVHYMMGGIHTDINGATTLPGLYAAGEAACVSINGANRLGSNSLTECLVFGARAGRAAAEYAKQKMDFSPHLESRAAEEGDRIEKAFFSSKGKVKGRNSDSGTGSNNNNNNSNSNSNSSGKINTRDKDSDSGSGVTGSRGRGGSESGEDGIAAIRNEMHQAMEDGAGIYRTEDSLKKSEGAIRELQQRLVDISLEDHSYTFNTELVSALELSYMLDVAEAIIQSALHRRESRGSHQRKDFPDRNDEKFLTHSLAYRSSDGSPGGTPRVEYEPVTITKWPPGERKYGR